MSLPDFEMAKALLPATSSKRGDLWRQSADLVEANFWLIHSTALMLQFCKSLNAVALALVVAEAEGDLGAGDELESYILDNRLT
jgi:hypothetical protein